MTDAPGSAPSTSAPRDPHGSPEAAKRLQRARFADRFAGRVIRIGGVGVLLAVIAIFVFVGAEAVPLLRGAEVTPHAVLDAGGPVAGAATDEYRAHVTAIRTDGSIAIVDTTTKAVTTRESPFGAGRKVVVSEDIHPSVQTFFLGSDDGRIAVVTGTTKLAFSEDGKRLVTPEIEAGEALDATPGSPITAIAGRVFDDDKAFVVCHGGGSLTLLRFKLGASRVRSAELALPGDGAAAAKLTSLTIALLTDEFRIYAGLADGRVVRWDAGWTDDARLHESFRAAESAITALEVLNGGETLVTGAADGSIATWFGVRASTNASNWDLTRIRTFDPVAAATGGVRRIAATQRGKGFAALGADGTGRVKYATTGSTRAELDDLLADGGAGAAAAPVTASFTPKNDGLLVADARGGIRLFHYADPHPESGITALFGKIWYEGGTEPEHKWQSTGGTDEFEPKLSLTTLVFGTMKGVVFALLFSVPVALLAAIYTALFLPARVKAWIKPTLEIMAALPSVVIGLLAALWLSPLVERNITSVFAALPAFLAVFTVLFIVWSRLPRHVRGNLSQGPGVLVLCSCTVALSVLLAASAGPAIESAAFGGDVKAWLRESLGLRYDPRNALVVGFAMGFAVIPVIFTIAEDAISNVPKSLWAASEALGASRWQTTVRVVLPAATPGIFAALMLGFGRAVGETMIVLMATGNTPLLEMSPFNGMRTISACVAVEIPEAPHGDTLYRVLFLAGALLFLFTFLCNTGAEVVASRLRRRYGRAG